MKKQHVNRKEVKTLPSGYGYFNWTTSETIESKTFCYNHEDDITLTRRMLVKAKAIITYLESTPWFSPL